MKKTTNINLGGYAYTIDDDAYDLLKDYLLSLKKYFKDTPSSDEVVRDIEYRMAEILEQEQNDRRRVITKDNIQGLIALMGTTEELEMAEEAHQSHQPNTDAPKVKSKRLFRDLDDKVIGGVCSGMAAYYGIDNTIYVRIIFVMTFLTFGFGILPYILLWIFVPAAKTAHDKMQMRGEDISISSIARSFEDELKNVGETITEISNAWKSKRSKA